MKKKKLKKKLDPVEIEEYFHWKHEESLKYLKESRNFEGVPSAGTCIECIRAYHRLKKGCLASFMDCQGNRYNDQAYGGVADECGDEHPFKIWRSFVKENRSKPYVTHFMDHFDMPLHSIPNLHQFDYFINLFYMAKYGLFTCHDAIVRPGRARFDEALFDLWEKRKED